MALHIELEGGYNVRDLGGYPTSDGSTIRPRQLIRAGSLQKLTEVGQQTLLDYGVKTIIDLRDEWEAAEYPNVFAQSTLVQYRNLPMMGNYLSQDSEWQREQAKRAGLHDLYALYLEYCQSQIGTIIGAIAEMPTTTLFHCYAGKDRTGIIAALLLSTADVSDEVIAEDYAQTTPQIQHLLVQWRQNADEDKRDRQKFERDIGSDAQTMVNLLAHIRTQYGGVNQYLQLCGLSSSQLESLKTRLVTGKMLT